MLDHRRWKRRLVNVLLLSLPVLSLAACRRNVGSLDDEFLNARSLLRSELYDLALAKAEEGLNAAERTHNTIFKWRFRLIKVEILLGQRLPGPALNLLD